MKYMFQKDLEGRGDYHSVLGKKVPKIFVGMMQEFYRNQFNSTGKTQEHEFFSVFKTCPKFVRSRVSLREKKR